MTDEEHISGVISRTLNHGNKTYFYIDGRTIQIDVIRKSFEYEFACPFIEFRELAGPKVLRFKIGWPGPNLFNYLAKRTIEVFSRKHLYSEST